MIPILSIEDVELVEDEILKQGLLKEFERLPDDYEYPNFGYFIVIENEGELEHPIPLAYGSQAFVPEPLSEWVEMVEEFEGYRQMVLVLESDFGVSLFLLNVYCNNQHLLRSLKIYI